MILEFNITDQILKRIDSNIPVANSKRFLQAKFNLPSEYTGTITATVKKYVNGSAVAVDYTVDKETGLTNYLDNIIQSESPKEVLLYFSLSSTDADIHIPTNQEIVPLKPSGQGLTALPMPGQTTNQYEEIATKYAEVMQTAESVSQSLDSVLETESSVKASEDNAKVSESNAKVSEDNAKLSENTVKGIADNLQTVVDNANDKANLANTAASNANDKAALADEAAANAQNTATNLETAYVPRLSGVELQLAQITNQKLDKNASQSVSADMIKDDAKQQWTGGAVAIVGANCIDEKHFTNDTAKIFGYYTDVTLIHQIGVKCRINTKPYYPVSDQYMRCVELICAAGEKYKVKAKVTSSISGYVFLNAAGDIVSNRAIGSVTEIIDEEFYAPTNAVKLYINSAVDYIPTLKKIILYNPQTNDNNIKAELYKVKKYSDINNSSDNLFSSFASFSSATVNGWIANVTGQNGGMITSSFSPIQSSVIFKLKGSFTVPTLAVQLGVTKADNSTTYYSLTTITGGAIDKTISFKPSDYVGAVSFKILLNSINSTQTGTITITDIQINDVPDYQVSSYYDASFPNMMKKVFDNIDNIKGTMAAKTVIDILVGTSVPLNFSTVKAAVNSITDASDNKVYNIYIEDGTYAEYAITLPPNVNLRGKSKIKENVVIKGELPDSAVDNDITNNSTINITGTNTLEYITVTAKNLRYPIHSESGGAVKDWIQFVNHCFVEHLGTDGAKAYRIANSLDYSNLWVTCHAWGEGASSGAYAEFNHSIFKSVEKAWYVHEAVSQEKPYIHVLNNCLLYGKDYAVEISSVRDPGQLNSVIFNNCLIGGAVAITGTYAVDVRFCGCGKDIPMSFSGTEWKGTKMNPKITDCTRRCVYTGSAALTGGEILQYDGLNNVKKATSTTPISLLAGYAIGTANTGDMILVSKNNYYPNYKTLGQYVAVDDNGNIVNASDSTKAIGIGQTNWIKMFW